MNKEVDTITVELPIEVTESGNIQIEGIATYDRKTWRYLADNYAWGLARAVVAWIERDEWKSLPAPQIGQRVRATLRDGREIVGKVFEALEAMDWVYIGIEGYEDEEYHVNLSPNVAHCGKDIVSWDYLDKDGEVFEPLPVPEKGRTIKATLRSGREVEGEVAYVKDYGRIGFIMVKVSYPSSLTEDFFINTSPPTGLIKDSHDIVSWEYADEEEFEALPIPIKGRTIRAVLRNGEEVEGEVVRSHRKLRYVLIDLNPLWSTVYINTSPGRAETPNDIVSWEYVDDDSLLEKVEDLRSSLEDFLNGIGESEDA